MMQESNAARVNIFGVDYIHIQSQGDLYITKYGEPFLEHLLPENWNDKRYYDQHPDKKVVLPGSGKPYRLETQPVDGKSVLVVIKWCRIGTYTYIAKSPRMDFISDEDITNASWNGPFQEFGLLEEFRGTNKFFDKQIRTQIPLAIFSPEERTELWRTGRHKHSFHNHNQIMRQAQANSGFAPIELDVQRLYAMIYQWVVGDDVGVVYQNLQVDNELPNLVRNIYENDILGRGYSIVDTKPDHIIVRTEDGEIIRDRNGEIVYALIDFELLRRTREFEHIHKTKQRNKYWNLIFHGGKKAAIPDDRKYVNILGVDYVYGSASNGGRLWVVGKNPELFDYYEPVKWRRTPRSKLSLTTSRTTTQDSIQLVYKESRVKMIPSGEPDSEICLFGYNSPFEEVAIAQDLRRLGIPVVLPRAIYRTSHESYPTEFLEDSSRIESHQQMMIDEERILSDNHDYMLLYGLWRGIDPLQDFKEQGHWGMLDVEQAYGFGLITDTERIDIINDTRERLCNAGFSVPLRDDRFILYSEKDVLRRDQKNRYDVIISIDGNRAFRRKLLTKEQFTSEMNQLADQLKTHNYVPLNLRDSHVLFSMNPDGVLKKSNGTLEKVLCNFEQIRPHWFQASYNAIS